MNEYLNLTSEWQKAMMGGAIGALIAIGILFILFVVFALYIYHSLAWMKIAKKMKYKRAWLAWIPFGSSAMRLQLGKFHWAWVFLWIFPPAVIVLLTIAMWRIFERLRYPGWLALSFPVMFIPGIAWIGGIAYLVNIGIVAWRKK